jgi:GntR family transcriptional repressor for pyruvate dehydrogenase complex
MARVNPLVTVDRARPRRSGPPSAAANINWHNAVARASGNELLAAFLYSVSYGVAVATTTAEYDTMDTRKEVIRIYSRINDAIEARNADLAERHMRRHIVATNARAGAPETMHIALSG